MKKSILIIDKDPSIVLAFKRILIKEKIKVLSASDIEQGMQRITDKNPMLIFLDMDLNALSTNSIDRIKLLFPKIPLIVLTTYSNTITHTLAIKMGADDYLTKPFNIQDMLRKTTQFLNSPTKDS